MKMTNLSDLQAAILTLVIQPGRDIPKSLTALYGASLRALANAVAASCSGPVVLQLFQSGSLVANFPDERGVSRTILTNVDDAVRHMHLAKKGLYTYVSVLADSVGPTGVRITTMQCCFPRFILAEVNTHRMLSRCSASSRAVSVEKRIAGVREHAFVPKAFSKNRRGMQAFEEVQDQDTARDIWLQGAAAAIEAAEKLNKAGVHKQHANRLLEPFMWHTAVLTATEWENMLALRTELTGEGVPTAQPEFYELALLMQHMRQVSVPTTLGAHQWHLPYITQEDRNHIIDGTELAKISATRCARTSTLHHDKEDIDYKEDLELYDRLVSSAHWSPLEHPARPLGRDASGDVSHSIRTNGTRWVSNLQEWVSLRSTYWGEAVRVPPRRGRLLCGSHRAASGRRPSR